MAQAVVGSKKSDPLRQQLDELDQLMQRMLALGVNQSPPDLVPDPEPEAVEFVEVGAKLRRAPKATQLAKSLRL